MSILHKQLSAHLVSAELRTKPQILTAGRAYSLCGTCIINGSPRASSCGEISRRDGFRITGLMKINNFFAELKRRNVYKVAVAYVVVSWLLIQVATQVFPFFNIPNWAVRLVVLLLVLGFPVALILSWAFEITPEGIKREPEVEHVRPIARRTGRKIVGLTAVAAAIAAGLVLFQL